MSNNANPLTLPTQEPRRRRTLNIRMTTEEREAVDHLAAIQGVTASALARHFLLQAVTYYQKQTQRVGEEGRHDSLNR